MTAILEWLLGVDRLHWSAGTLSVELGDAPERWGMLAGAVLVVALVALLYRFEAGSRRLRVTLAGVRICLLLMVLGLLSFPNLVVTRDRIEPAVLAVLVDASGSMNERDADPPAASAASRPSDRSRWDVASRSAREVLAAGDAERQEGVRVETWTFADRAARIARGDEAAVAAELPPPAEGAASDLVQSLEDVLAQSRGRHLTDVLILGDGRQSISRDPGAVLAEAARRGIRIHAAAIGSTVPRRDVAVDALAVNEDVFRRDVATIRTRVTATAVAAGVPIEVVLTAADSGRVLDRRTAPPADSGADADARPSGPTDSNAPDAKSAAGREVGDAAVADAAPSGDTEPQRTIELELQFRPEEAGLQPLRVSVTPLPDEAVTTNNAAELAVRVHDQKIRVLYVDGPPRFEYRFLKNMLLREPTVASSCLMLDATAAFVQEGSDPIRGFPVSPGELGAYDVVLLGDVDPRGDWISPAQVAMLIDFVSGGGGIGFIAGERAMPRRLSGTPLARLLPVRIDSAVGRPDPAPAARPFVLAATSVGRRHPLLRFELDPAENDATLAALQPWYWAASVLGPQPGAEVLAAHPTEVCAGGPLPLIVTGRYGAGRTLYVGSDDVWRWRRYRGEAFYEAFWLSALRMLAAEHRWGASRAWRLESDRRYCDVGQPVTFRLVGRGDSAAQGGWVAPQSNSPGQVSPGTGLSQADAVLRIAGRDGSPLAELPMLPAADGSAALEATYRPDRPGTVTGSAAAPDAIGASKPAVLTRQVTVSDTSPERRRVQADPGFLESLTRATGGRMLKAHAAPELAREIPQRARRISDDLVTPLWDTPLTLAAFMLLIAVEWTARRWKGLA